MTMLTLPDDTTVEATLIPHDLQAVHRTVTFPHEDGDVYFDVAIIRWPGSPPDAFAIFYRRHVRGVLSFFRSAPPGTVYTPDSDWPGNITGRYNEFGGAELAGPGGLLTGKQLGTLSGTELTRAIEHSHPNPDEPVYVLITKSMLQFGLAYGFLQPHDLEKLSNTLNNAPGWFQLYNSNGVTVYELPPSS